MSIKELLHVKTLSMGRILCSAHQLAMRVGE